MERFWSIFWKLFGISLVLTVFLGIIAGFVLRSAGVTYAIVQGTFAIGSGVCGVIGLVVIPVEMFFEDRIKGGGTENAAK